MSESSPTFGLLDSYGKPERRCERCFIVETKQHRLLICPCKSARYCNKECQKADWKHHQWVCKINREESTKSGLRFEHAPGVSMLEIQEIMKKWVLVNKALLGNASVNALDLHTFPDRIDTHLFMITLYPTFDHTKLPKSKHEIARAFQLESTRVETKADTLANTTGDLKRTLAAALQTHGQKSKDYKRRGHEWRGVSAIVVGVPFFQALRVIPWPQQRELGPRTVEWEAALEMYLKTGKHL